MHRAVVLHTLRDIQHCVKHRLGRDYLLFATDPSVCVYARENYGLECSCLSKFFKLEEIISLKQYAGQRVDTILAGLDEQIAPSLNNEFGLSMFYFRSLYGYHGKHHYAARMFFIESLKRAIRELGLEEVSVYAYIFNRFLDTQAGMSSLSVSLSGVRVKVIDSEDIPLNKKMSFVTKLRFLRHLIDRPGLKKRDRFKFVNSRKNILIYGDLYFLDFLRDQLNAYNVIDFGEGDTPSAMGMFFQDPVVSAPLISDKQFDIRLDEHNNIDDLFIEDIRQDFKKNIGKYLHGVRVLEELHRRFPISLGIWGTPLTGGLKSLVFEFLTSQKVPVLGAQHGCVYGDSFEPWHFFSDFDRCDYFISFGFTAEDFKRLYPDRKPKAQILPLGAVAKPVSLRRKRSIDLLFPISNSASIFAGGMIRTPPDILTQRQIALLEYLDSFKGASIYIKPFSSLSFNTCAFLPVLKRLKNVRVVYGKSLLQFLEKYSPRSVLIEFPSQPLFEVLPLDTEIFLMDNSVRPFEEKALEELKKRVYYSSDLESVKLWIKLFLENNLSRKRNAEFYSHYAHKENSRENILSLVGGLMQGKR